MADYHLAQLNIARLLAPLDSPQLAGFVDNLERINALADEAPGFVWRLQTEDGDATALRPFGNDMIVNLSLWTDLAALHAYVYKSAHVEIMRGRKAWFQPLPDAHMVLWWVPSGDIPTVPEARDRLDQLRKLGPTPTGFTFARPFPMPGLEISN